MQGPVPRPLMPPRTHQACPHPQSFFVDAFAGHTLGDPPEYTHSGEGFEECKEALELIQKAGVSSRSQRGRCVHPWQVAVCVP
jgi:hypothetical protein